MSFIVRHCLMKSACLAAFLLLLCSFAQAEGLAGKVMCGYQGWFRTPEDGSGTNNWYHYTQAKTFEPGACNIDLWPDVRELRPEDRVPTPFRHPDGSVAEVFSSVRPGVVSTHFRWMKEYGIDGVFLQRFAVTTKDPRFRKSMDTVLDSCRGAARDTGRVWSLMYDLSGIKPGESGVVIADWKRLVADFHLGDAAANPAYLKHRGKPLVALWGLGFSDRAPMLDEWQELIRFFKEDAVPGGCSVMIGVPAFWRTLNRDAITDPKLHELISMADVVSPWTVGRYNSPEDAAKFTAKTVTGDVEWCQGKHLDYLPVAFPGFSWHNMSESRGKVAPVNAIPRLGGRFLWSQAYQYRKAGAQMLYVAMFDEMDEGTAIFKFRNDPPVGKSLFITEPEVPNDQYLWLTGQAGRLFRNQLPGDTAELPARSK